MDMKQKMNKIHNEDCLTFMKQVPDNYFDLVLTDPPYGINADIKQNANAGKKGGKKGGTYKKYHTSEWDKDIPSKEIFDEMFRISKNQIIWGGEYMTEHLYPNRGWIVWDKVVRANYPDGEMAWTSFDMGLQIYSYSRADAYINDLPNKVHPTQKPEKLMRFCLNKSIDRFTTHKVFDPFIGSGTTAVACQSLGLEWCGCELESDYVEIANKRLEKVQGSLF